MSKDHRQGHLFIISGPSGAGKGTICKELVSRANIDLSISMTTREPRPREVDGKDYYFVTKEEFLSNIDDNNLLEWANVHGNMYGTPKDAVIKKLNKGQDVILEIDVQGGLQVKKQMPEAVLIFILPPSISILRKRLEGRGTDAEDVIERRMNMAINEIKLLGEYDYYIVNDVLSEAVSRAESIMTAESMRVPAKVKSIIAKYENENEEDK